MKNKRTLNIAPTDSIYLIETSIVFVGMIKFVISIDWHLFMCQNYASNHKMFIFQHKIHLLILKKFFPTRGTLSILISKALLDHH